MPIELLVATLGDEDRYVGCAAAYALIKIDPEALSTVIPEVIAILQGQPSGTVLGSLNQGFIAEVLGGLGHTSPIILEKLTQLLNWPYWQVRMKAAHALGKLRRSIPNATIKRLLELQRDPDPKMQAVREAADDALAEILSLETGIEDD